MIKRLLLFGLAAFMILASCEKPSQKVYEQKKLRNGWFINSSEQVQTKGARISTSDYQVKDWYQVNIPTTVLAGLVEDGVYKQPYFGKNLKEIPAEKFENSWWFRKEFEVNSSELKHKNFINFKGINYYANIWLNGEKIGSRDSVFGAYRFFRFNVDDIVREGKNVLAVEVFQPQPGDFTVGFVDWNPTAPDQNMGLFRDVIWETTGDVSLSSPYVTSDIDLATLDKAKITLQLMVKNEDSKPVNGQVKFEFNNKKIEKDVSLQPNQKKLVELAPDKFQELTIDSPKLWWPHTIGKPNLYTAKVSFTVNNNISDQEEFKFGIREIEDYINKQGHRGYKINGRKILIKGAGWTDDLMLADTEAQNEARVKYAKHMDLNTIRLEGIWGKDEQIYDLCDKHGLLLMVGWSCHWEWKGYLGKEVDEFGGIKTEEDIQLVTDYWRDQILWLREHPSIFVWLGGSDMLPRPKLEKQYLEILEKYDSDRPYLGAAMGKDSEVTGKTRVKMRGPYKAVPPNYWYVDTAHGGAFGFNTETGPGAQVPPYESIIKMLPQNKLWPINDYWNYHCGRKEFNNLSLYNEYMYNRYWKPAGVKEYTQLAQVLNYELMRPMFEAFQVNRHESTGIIQWMFNSAWPAMYWQFFDSYLRPNGAFYGAKKANQPVHILYRYGFNDIWAVNVKSSANNDLVAKVKLYDQNSKLIYENQKTINLEKQSSMNVFDKLPLNSDHSLSFLDLRLYKDGKEIDNNFYWLPKEMDQLDYANNKWFVTPVKKYADLSAIENLPNVEIEKAWQKISNGKLKLTIKNKGNEIAFFIRSNLINAETGKSILPVFWSDNYISLLPNEKRELIVEYDENLVKDASLEIEVSGINLKNK